MKSTPIVSVVIPVYNCDAGIKQAIESVKAQTLHDWELIIVDDGSKDSTKELLDLIAKEDSRIRVAHQVNKGTYLARLTGMLMARGQYITTLDDDDTLDKKMLEEMYKIADLHKLDILECELSNIATNTGVLEITVGKDNVRERISKPQIFGGERYLCVCGKFYRREAIFSGKKLDDFEQCYLTTFDDALFNVQVFCSIESYGYIHIPYYQYNINDSSSVRNYTSKTYDGLVVMIAMLGKYAPKYGVDSADKSLTKWALKNIYNDVVCVSVANNLTFKESVHWLKLLLQADVVKSAWQGSLIKEMPAKISIIYYLGKWVPACILVLMFRIMGKVRGVR